MDFEEKIGRAKKSFKLAKQLHFIDPIWGLYATGIALGLGYLGMALASTVLLYTSLTISVIGVGCIYIGHRVFMRGIGFLELAEKEICQRMHESGAEERIEKYMGIDF